MGLLFRVGGNMKKISMALVAIMASVMLIAGCAEKTQTQTQTNTDKKTFKIGVIQQGDHKSLEAARDGFADAIKEMDLPFEIVVKNGQFDSSNLKTIAQLFVNDEVDLIMAIGTGSAQIAASETSKIPILGTAITDYETAKLVQSKDKPGTNVSGTSDMGPIDKQLSLLTEVFPETKTVGLLYTASENNSVVQIKEAKEVLDKMGIAYVEKAVNSVSEIEPAVQSMVGNIQGIYIPTDNNIASNMPMVDKVASANKIPVVAAAGDMVRDGGTLTWGIDYYELGKLTAKMAKEVLIDGKDITTMPIQFMSEYELVVNEASMKNLGATLPEKYAQMLSK